MSTDELNKLLQRQREMVRQRMLQEALKLQRETVKMEFTAAAADIPKTEIKQEKLNQLKRKQLRSRITLIEVMVAVTILSVLVVLGIGSLCNDREEKLQTGWEKVK